MSLLLHLLSIYRLFCTSLLKDGYVRVSSTGNLGSLLNNTLWFHRMADKQVADMHLGCKDVQGREMLCTKAIL